MEYLFIVFVLHAKNPAIAYILAHSAKIDMQLPFKVVSLYEYSSGYEDDLNFAEHQIITVDSVEDDQWFHGFFVEGGIKKEGIFPKNFVQSVIEKGDQKDDDEPLKGLGQSAEVKDQPMKGVNEAKSEVDPESEAIVPEVSQPKVTTSESKVEQAERAIQKENAFQKENLTGIKSAESTEPPLKSEEPESEGPTLSLKDRIALLQKQQKEQAEREAKRMQKEAETKKRRESIDETVDQVPATDVSKLDPNHETGEDLPGEDAFVEVAEEEEGSEDEEETKRRELTERMAKLSGGMGMFGMMGMSPFAKKAGKEKESVEKSEKVPEEAENEETETEETETEEPEEPEFQEAPEPEEPSDSSPEYPDDAEEALEPVEPEFEFEDSEAAAEYIVPNSAIPPVSKELDAKAPSIEQRRVSIPNVPPPVLETNEPLQGFEGAAPMEAPREAPQELGAPPIPPVPAPPMEAPMEAPRAPQVSHTDPQLSQSQSSKPQLPPITTTPSKPPVPHTNLPFQSPTTKPPMPPIPNSPSTKAPHLESPSVKPPVPQQIPPPTAPVPTHAPPSFFDEEDEPETEMEPEKAQTHSPMVPSSVSPVTATRSTSLHSNTTDEESVGYEADEDTDISAPAWWLEDSLPEPLNSKINKSLIYEVDTQKVPKRNNVVLIAKDFYVLNSNYSQKVYSVTYIQSSPHQTVHIKESEIAAPNLDSISNPKIFQIIHSAIGQSCTGELFGFLSEKLPELVKPIGKFYGLTVYRNGSNHQISQSSDFQRGDIVCFSQATFRTQNKLHQSKKVHVGVDRIHETVLLEFDQTKQKLRVAEVRHGKIVKESYKIGELVEGTIRVFRCVKRSDVKWGGGVVK